MEGASAWDAPRRRGAMLQPLSITTFRRSSRGQTPFHYYFRGCCAKSWSIWAFLLSLGSIAAGLCRERFTLEKWNQSAGYSALSGVPPMVALPVPPRLKQDELPVETTPPVPTPEATSAGSAYDSY
ncbi:hypothetical protein CK203_077531 [Vitis vinifera]|uniref:Uncharacterized protein n=1 Tax=Vitis vinifera TaxID=29760 RepID=A0A438DT87_VITVI|nr:hypothetical protein CK203_077531 [Vitis vinifera]